MDKSSSNDLLWIRVLWIEDLLKGFLNDKALYGLIWTYKTLQRSSVDKRVRGGFYIIYKTLYIYI